mgnify:FL=1
MKKKRLVVCRMLWIRTIQKLDYTAVDRLLMQLHQLDVAERPDRFATADHYMSRESFELLLENENVLTFLAQERTTIVGCCFVSLLERNEGTPTKTAYIDLLVVDEAYRRKGIGKALFQAVRKQARRLHAQNVELMVWSHNEVAVKAYESYGMMPQRSIYEISV